MAQTADNAPMDGPTTLPASLPVKDYLTLVVAALAFLVAWRAYVVNAHKLRLDLYHMRYALCKEIMELAEHATNDQWRDEWASKRHTLMLEARFLFGLQTEIKIEAIFFEILNYRFSDLMVKNPHDKGIDQAEFQNKRAESWKEIHSIKYRIAAELQPYLDFHNVGRSGVWMSKLNGMFAKIKANMDRESP